MVNKNFPYYGDYFWCIDKDDNLLINPIFPKVQTMLYLDETGNLDGDVYWCLLEDFSILYKLDDIWYKITCKKEFDFDFASIPRIFRSLVGDKDSPDIQVASLFHDLFYTVHHKLFPKDISDKFLGKVLRCYGGSAAKEIGVYSAVKSCGWMFWKKTKEDLIKYNKFIEVVKYDGKTL